jgi:hypothetical protein
VSCQSQPSIVQQLVNGAWVSLKPHAANTSYPAPENPVVFDTVSSTAGSVQSIRACTVEGADTVCDAPTNVAITNCCVAQTCQTGMCGTQADGCGGEITCGGCAAGEECVAGLCADTGPGAACEAEGGAYVDGKCIKVPIPKCGGDLPC